MNSWKYKPLQVFFIAKKVKFQGIGEWKLYKVGLLMETSPGQSRVSFAHCKGELESSILWREPQGHIQEYNDPQFRMIY